MLLRTIGLGKKIYTGGKKGFLIICKLFGLYVNLNVSNLRDFFCGYVVTYLLGINQLYLTKVISFRMEEACGLLSTTKNAITCRFLIQGWYLLYLEFS